MDLQRIIQKPSDFKVCNYCNHLNWYENEECCSCQETDFINTEGNVIFCIEREYKYWIEEEFYTEEEADNVQIDV